MVGFIFLAGATAQEFQWNQFQGTRLRVLASKFAWIDNIKEWVPEFEKKTGMKVNIEVYPFKPLMQKYVIEFSSGNADIDAFMNFKAQTGTRFYDNGWIEPLDGYVSNPQITNLEFQLSDYFPGYINYSSIYGKLCGIPINAAAPVLFYRTDLFNQYALEAPHTFAEWEMAAQKLTLDIDGDGTKDLFGIGMRGSMVPMAGWQPFLFGFGGRWLDAAGNPIFNSPLGVKSLALYASMLQKSGPPGAAGSGWQEMANLFKQGRLAMYFDTIAHYVYFVDPSKSKVVDKFSLAVVPKGPAGRFPWLGGWMLCIGRQSQKKEPAWLFVQWATGDEISTRIQRKGFATASISAWNDEQFKESVIPEYPKVAVSTYSLGVPKFLPEVPNPMEIMGYLESAVTRAIEGENPQKTLNEAAREVKKILEEQLNKKLELVF